MKIGTTLNIEYKQQGNDKIEKYRSKIIGINDRYLFLDYPVHKKTQKTSFFMNDAYFLAMYIGTDQNLYSFHTKIVKRTKLKNVPALAIMVPDKDHIRHIQRREYVRIKTSVDIAIHCPKDTFLPYTTVTSDISGGGLSFVIPNRKTITNGHKLDIWIVLRMHSGKFKYHYAHAEFLRSELVYNIPIGSLKYLSIANQARQDIIQYCFEKQRETRKMELNISDI